MRLNGEMKAGDIGDIGWGVRIGDAVGLPSGSRGSVMDGTADPGPTTTAHLYSYVSCHTLD